MIAPPVGPDLRTVVVASPAYLATQFMPDTPHDLMLHRCINYRMMASGLTYDWEFEQDGRELAIKLTGPLTFNDPALMLQAALDGLGIAYVPENQARRDIDIGRLIQLLRDFTPPFRGYFLSYSSRRQMPPTLAR